MYQLIGALLGFTNLGDIDAHLTWFEQSLQDDDSQNPSLANTMLVIMVRGLYMASVRGNCWGNHNQDSHAMDAKENHPLLRRPGHKMSS